MTDDEKSVYIKNIYTDEYLSATESKYSSDTSYRKVSLTTRPGGNEYKWTLKYTNPTSLLILNTKYSSEYLRSYSGTSENNNYAIGTYSSTWTWRTFNC